jgi:hypothetical protein
VFLVPVHINTFLNHWRESREGSLTNFRGVWPYPKALT